MDFKHFHRPKEGTWRWLSVAGPDAQDYLHRLTTVDVQKLPVGDGSAGFLLSSKGLVASYFYLWRLSDHQFVIELAAGADQTWLNETTRLLEFYHFGEDLEFSVKDTRPLWLFNPAADSELKLQQQSDLTFFQHGHRDFGQSWISVWGAQADLENWEKENLANASEVNLQEVEAWRVLANRGAVDAEITPEVNPLEMGMIDGVALNKGCYPGQEVIEKIYSRGQPARRLVRIEGQKQSDLPNSGDTLLNLADPPTEVGQITTVVPHENSFIALGLVRKIHAKKGLEVQLKGGQKASIADVTSYE